MKKTRRSSSKAKKIRLGILGLGKMGEALIEGLRKSDTTYEILATTRSEKSAEEARRRHHVDCRTDNRWLVKESDVIILAVKPHQAEGVLRECSADLSEEKILISVCASLTTEQLAHWAQKAQGVVRAMPNTPCLVGQGVTALSAGPRATPAQLEQAKKIFSALGWALVVEENLFDAITGLSGCGPAYVFLVIEALSDGGVKAGLPREVAVRLAAQTLLGSAQMVLSRGEHPAALKDEVSTPAGCTVEGLMALEEGRLRVALIRAVLAATARSQELGRQSED